MKLAILLCIIKIFWIPLCCCTFLKFSGNWTHKIRDKRNVAHDLVVNPEKFFSAPLLSPHPIRITQKQNSSENKFLFFFVCWTNSIRKAVFYVMVAAQGFTDFVFIRKCGWFWFNRKIKNVGPNEFSFFQGKSVKKGSVNSK
jgi:hypothetical protein